MHTSRWSVRLVVEEGECGPLSEAILEALTSEIHYLTMSGPAGEHHDGAPVVTFELEAPDARNAKILAQHLLGKLQHAAGLRVRKAPIVWVAPLLATEGSGHRFRSHARELFEAEDAYDLAVVAAQIHLEVQVTALVERAVVGDESPVVRALSRERRSWAPHDRWARPILEALFDIRMAEFPRWREYNAHVARRNDVVHRGQDIDADAARESLDVVEELWLWLNERAAQDSRPGERPLHVGIGFGPAQLVGGP